MNKQKLLQLTFRFSFILLAITTGLLLISLLIPVVAVISLPTTWPFLIVFGADETTEMYGPYGELLRAWLSAIPICFLYGIFIAWIRIEKAAA